MKVKCISNKNGILSPKLTIGKEYEILQFTHIIDSLRSVKIIDDQQMESWFGMSFFENRALPTINEIRDRINDLRMKLVDSNSDSDIDFILKTKNYYESQLAELQKNPMHLN